MSKNILIIDYKTGNIGSLINSIEYLGYNYILSSNRENFNTFTHIILPGVGSFYHGMKNLEEMNLVNFLLESVIEKNKPILGICLGMQLLASKGFEVFETKGLNLIEGEVIQFDKKKIKIIPHVGWNSVHFSSELENFSNIFNNKDFYFTHSYHFLENKKENVLAYTEYNNFSFTSIIQKDNILGVQFHPEKSHKTGLSFIKNFIEYF